MVIEVRVHGVISLGKRSVPVDKVRSRARFRGPIRHRSPRPARRSWTAATASRCTVRSRSRSATGSAPDTSPPGPPSRPPARSPRDLGVSRGVVVEAYAQLVAEGYLTSRQRRLHPGRRAGGRAAGEPATDAAAPRSSARRSRSPAVDFGYGRGRRRRLPAVGLAALGAPRAGRGARRAASAISTGSGAPELRTALAEYLNRVRGTSAQPENVVITQRLRPGRSRCSSACSPRAAPGASRSRTPRPTTTSARSRPRLGLEVVGVPVDARRPAHRRARSRSTPTR